MEKKEYLVTVRGLTKYFDAKTDMASVFGKGSRRKIKAVDGVSFEVCDGEILGLVGESGSGKTTLGRLLVLLENPDMGEIVIQGKAVTNLKGSGLKAFYRNVQMVFQDPYESLNPRFNVFETVAEPLRIQRLCRHDEYQDQVERTLENAGLKPPRQFLDKFPHELSGGERQRLSIARALVLNPKMIVADEPVSMLDVSIKAGILNLLKKFSRERGMTILYISHDLSTVKYLCDRLMLMYLGKFMEIGPADEVIDHPRHPYAIALKAAIPVPDPRFKRKRGLSENIAEKYLQNMEGCRFIMDCSQTAAICKISEPKLTEVEPGHFVACHFAEDIIR